jgi:DNA invertase Pin-like site-specific DNA recombinase
MSASAYCRVSRESQAEHGHSLPAQRACIDAAARRLGFSEVAWFEDAGLSGAKCLEDRPGLLAAVSALKKGDVLFVAKRDRLGRDPIVIAMTERLIQRKGARLVSVAGEGTESEDPSSILMRRLIDAFSEFERLIISQRTRTSLALLKSQSRRCGTVKWGFQVNSEGFLVPDPREQEIIRQARELRGEGRSFRDIVTELDNRGVRGRTGRRLEVAQVHSMLKVDEKEVA